MCNVLYSEERGLCGSTVHGAIMWTCKKHLNGCGHNLYIGTVDVTGISPRATMRKCDDHLCISTIIVCEPHSRKKYCSEMYLCGTFHPI